MSLSAAIPAESWIHATWGSIGAVLGIVLIDVVLAGDNAVVIALAVRRLEPRARRIGILVGAGIAVVLRVFLTFVAMQILSLPGLKLLGALLILWIAIKLLRDNTGDAAAPDRTANSLRQAIILIVVADLTMSLDNVLAVAGAARGHLGLLVFGLVVSIPLVVFSSNFLARVMDRFPAAVYVGAGILGWVAGGMAVTDGWIQARWPAAPWVAPAAEGLAAGLVLLTSLLPRRTDRS